MGNLFKKYKSKVINNGRKFLSTIDFFEMNLYKKELQNFNPLSNSNDNFPNPRPIGELVNNDFSASSWTYSGVGTMTNNANNITFTGGNGTLTNIARYTALTSALAQSTITARVTMSNTNATNGLFALGFYSRQDNNLRHYIAIDNRATANKGNVLFYYTNAFNSWTNPSFLPFTDGDTMEFLIDQTLNQTVFRIKNYTQNSAYLSITLNQSIAFGGAFQNIINVHDLALWNHSGTNVLTYFNYTSQEYAFADMFIGTSKVHGFYAGTKAQRASEVFETNTGNHIVNLGAQSCALEHFVLLTNLITRLKPRRIIFLDPFRNNIVAGTFNATAQTNFQTLVTLGNSLGSQLWYHYAIPETVLNQSAGDTYLNSVAPADRIVPVPVGWVAATHTSDGVHPNVTGNSMLGNNLSTYIL